MEKSGMNYYYPTENYWPNSEAETTGEEILSLDHAAVIAGRQSSPYYRGLTDVPDSTISPSQGWVEKLLAKREKHLATTTYNISSSSTAEKAALSYDFVISTRVAASTPRFIDQLFLYDRIKRQTAGEDFMHHLHRQLNMINYNSSDEASRHEQNPEVRIDMECVENDIERRGQQSNHHLMINFNELEFEKPRLLFEDSYETMRETTLALGGQAVGAVMTNALASASSLSASTRAVWLSEIAVALGLCFIMAGISMRVKRPSFSIMMTKFGAIATSSAIVLSLGTHLPPVMAWTVAPAAFFMVAAAVAFA